MRFAVADHLNFREGRVERSMSLSLRMKDASEHVDHAFLRTENIIESSVFETARNVLSATPGARSGPFARD